MTGSPQACGFALQGTGGFAAARVGRWKRQHTAGRGWCGDLTTRPETAANREIGVPRLLAAGGLWLVGALLLDFFDLIDQVVGLFDQCGALVGGLYSVGFAAVQKV
jgi:hypothetical protein